VRVFPTTYPVSLHKTNTRRMQSPGAPYACCRRTAGAQCGECGCLSAAAKRAGRKLHVSPQACACPRGHGACTVAAPARGHQIKREFGRPRGAGRLASAASSPAPAPGYRTRRSARDRAKADRRVDMIFAIGSSEIAEHPCTRIGIPEYCLVNVRTCDTVPANYPEKETQNYHLPVIMDVNLQY
jgi:hypothetical protein